MITYAPLFSHETDEAPQNVFTDIAAADNWAGRVLTAQPGIEVEMMQNIHGAGWRSIDSGQTIREVRANRWQDPNAEDGASRD